MGRCKTTSCNFCLWNWLEPINLPQKTCYNIQSPKYHKHAVGGCAHFEPPAPDSPDFIKYRYPENKPKKKKKKNKKESDSHGAS